MRSVADFMAAGRAAGRYLLSISSGIAALGAITVVANFEMGYEAGFAMSWWGLSMALVTTILAVSGWVNYRFRETRALTLAEFFERRYSRRFRIFAGLVAFSAGLINFGIFPAVGARFFIYFMDLPPSYALLGLTLPTYPTAMLILLATALYFVYSGGQVAVILTDFLQGMVTNTVFVVLAVFLMLSADVLSRMPPGKSKLNPFDTNYVETFNFWYFLIGVFGVMYGAMSWQGTQAYNTSAKSAHEAKMGLVMGIWRGYPTGLVMLFVPILAFTVMHHPDWTGLQNDVTSTLATIDGAAVRNQMRVPLVLAKLLPTGLIGAMAAVMLSAFVSTHTTYLHSWGTIFIQDVVMPFRKAPMAPEQHLRLLRWAIAGVAVFIFMFSLLYEQNQAILLFFAITGAIFAGGSGAVIIGGLYWKRGTTPAAWTAMLSGSSIAVSGIILGKASDDMKSTGKAFWGAFDWLAPDAATGAAQWIATNLPNGQEIWGLGMACSAVLYVLVSLLYKPREFDLDRLLHRGPHAIAGETTVEDPAPSRGWRMLGMGREFSRRDRALYVLTYTWTAAWTIVFIIGTSWFLTRRVTHGNWGGYDSVWIRYWEIYLWIQIGISAVVVIWFGIGGLSDLRSMIRQLATMERDPNDDGRVRDDEA